MASEQRCPLCGEEMMDATPNGYYGLRLMVRWPDKWLPRTSDVQARVCLECGYVMLFATDPQRLRQP